MSIQLHLTIGLPLVIFHKLQQNNQLNYSRKNEMTVARKNIVDTETEVLFTGM
jgi:hypothetical protein